MIGTILVVSRVSSGRTVSLKDGAEKVTMDCRHIQFRVHDEFPQIDHSPLDLEKLKGLFQAAAFWAKDRQVEDLAIALANSKPVVSVWDGASAIPSENRLIGFARATSDGVYRATIWDVIIHPDYQGAGLGRKLVETVLMHPHVNRVERVYLMTTHQQHFYERIGFECNSTTTMVLYNQRISEPYPTLAAETSQ